MCSVEPVCRASASPLTYNSSPFFGHSGTLNHDRTKELDFMYTRALLLETNNLITQCLSMLSPQLKRSKRFWGWIQQSFPPPSQINMFHISTFFSPGGLFSFQTLVIKQLKSLHNIPMTKDFLPVSSFSILRQHLLYLFFELQGVFIFGWNESGCRFERSTAVLFLRAGRWVLDCVSFVGGARQRKWAWLLEEFCNPGT